MKKLIALAGLAMAPAAYAGIVGFDARLTGGHSNGGAFNAELAAEENLVPDCLRLGLVDGHATTFCVESPTLDPGHWCPERTCLWARRSLPAGCVQANLADRQW